MNKIIKNSDIQEMKKAKFVIPDSVGAVVLAAGKGSRLNSRKKNKVVIDLGGKPMVLWTVERLKQAGIEDVTVVVGFAADTVREVLGSSVNYVIQKKLLGTGHAAGVGMKGLSLSTDHVLVVYGDHSAFYTPDFYKKMVRKHLKEKNSMTLVTVMKNNPSELAWGRIIRGEDGCVTNIVEERDCTPEQKKITELNAGCYVFDRRVLEAAVPELEAHENGEFYLTDVAFYCMKNGLRVGAIKATDRMVGIGVNTKEQKELARKMFGTDVEK